jgi:hypothetical protein
VFVVAAAVLPSALECVYWDARGLATSSSGAALATAALVALCCGIYRVAQSLGRPKPGVYLCVAAANLPLLDRAVIRLLDVGGFSGDWNFVSDGRHALAASTDRDARAFLVDLSRDPEWTTNLLDAKPGTAAVFRDRAADLPAFEGAATPATMDRETEERLRSLGYVD